MKSTRCFNPLLRLFSFFLYLLPQALSATFFSNPVQPALQMNGILNSPRDWYCLRVGYVADSLYHQRFGDEFPQISSVDSNIRLTTDASLVTLNIKNWFDFNVVIGSSQIQMDQEVFTKRQFTWAAGFKCLIYRINIISFAFDFKYFETKQKPRYFLSEGSSFNVLSPFHLNYSEVQAAFGLAVQAAFLYPYLYGTYLYSRIDPNPFRIVLKYPFYNQSFDTTSRTVTSKNRWGLAMGTTILAGSQGSLTLETRLFNQNAVTVTGEVRF